MRWRLLALLAWVLPGPTVDPFRGNQSPSWMHLLGTDALGRDGLHRLLIGALRSAGFASACALGAISLGLLLAAGAPALRHPAAALRRIPPLLLLLPLAAVTGPFGWFTLGTLLSGLLALHLAPPLALQVDTLHASSAWKAERIMGSTFPSRLRRWAPWAWEQSLPLFPTAWLGALWAEATLRTLGFGPGPGTDTLGRLLQEELPRLSTDPTPLGWAALVTVLVLAWTCTPEVRA